MPITTIFALLFAYTIFVMPFTEDAQRRAKDPRDHTNAYYYIGALILLIISFALGL